MLIKAGKLYQSFGRSNYPFSCLVVGSDYFYDLRKNDIFLVIDTKQETRSYLYGLECKILTADGTICRLEINEKWDKESLWYFEEVK